jgi:thioredoxin 1
MNTTTQGHVASVNDQNFEEHVLKATRPVIVDFTADWCPPCRALGPVYHRLSHEFAARLDFVELDFDGSSEVPALMGVQALPTLIVFHQGRELARFVGPRPTNLKALIEGVLAKNSLA